MEGFKSLPDESIDLVVTDPPYKIIAGGVRIVDVGDECGGVLRKRDYSKTDPKGVLGRGRKVVSDGTACSNKWLKKGEGDIPSAVRQGKMFQHNEIKFKEWLPEVYRVLRRRSHAYIMSNARNLFELQEFARISGFQFQQLIVWKKNNKTPNKYYMNQCEFILMLSKRPARNINNMGSSNVLEIPNILATKDHPTQKPVELLEILIANSSSVGETVLDPFMGTGATAIASKNLNRNFIGFEIDKEYFDIANNKINL